MEETFKFFASSVALCLEAAVVVTVLVGAIETVVACARFLAARGSAAVGARHLIWMGFARWLLLALEFALGADIVRSAIAPSWSDIGQLGAIALIRTFLGFFLEKDIDEFGKPAKVELLRDVTPAVGLGAASVQALEQWRWKPATKTGVRVKTWLAATQTTVPISLHHLDSFKVSTGCDDISRIRLAITLPKYHLVNVEGGHRGDIGANSVYATIGSILLS